MRRCCATSLLAGQRGRIPLRAPAPAHHRHPDQRTRPLGRRADARALARDRGLPAREGALDPRQARGQRAAAGKPRTIFGESGETLPLHGREVVLVVSQSKRAVNLDRHRPAYRHPRAASQGRGAHAAAALAESPRAGHAGPARGALRGARQPAAAAAEALQRPHAVGRVHGERPHPPVLAAGAPRSRNWPTTWSRTRSRTWWN